MYWNVCSGVIRSWELYGFWMVASQKGCRPFRNIVDYGMKRPQKRY